LPSLAAALAVCGLAGCRPDAPKEYPASGSMVDQQRNVLELHRDGIIFRSYGVIPDYSLRGNKLAYGKTMCRAQTAK
jgi:hypothetical protein